MEISNEMSLRKNSQELDEPPTNVPAPERGPVKWRVRPMRFGDIERCLEIWLQVELAEASVTVANALSIDPDGLYVAELESSGAVVGMCSGLLARRDTAFMGFYAVAPEYQGIGIGRELWAKTVARLEESKCNIGLYGVPGMSEKYEKSGFKLEDSIRMHIFESEPCQRLRTGELKSLRDLQADSSSSAHCFQMLNRRSDFDEMTFQQLIEYDAQIHGESRDKLLRNYLLEADEVPLTVAIIKTSLPRGKTSAENEAGQQQQGHLDEANSCCPDRSIAAGSDFQETLSAGIKDSLAITQTCPTDNEQLLLGYGCIRHDNTGGAMIGPLYARSSGVCEVILRHLIEEFTMEPGGKYSVMSLTSNEQADELLRLIGLRKMDQCSRMFTKFIPEAPLEQIYYVHSPNFTLF